MKEEARDRALYLEVRLPRVYEFGEPPDWPGLEVPIGTDTEEILEAALIRGYVPLPMEASRLKTSLKNAVLYQCWDRELPFVMVEIDAEWGGQVTYDFRPQRTQIPSAVFQLFRAELVEYLRSHGEAQSPKVYLEDVARHSRFPMLLSPDVGCIAFSAGRYDLIQTVLGYVEETRTRTWISQAPKNPDSPDESDA